MPEYEFVTTLPVLSARAPDGHKGDYGHVLVVAGSREMSGAAVLCAGGALRVGAGLVTVATPNPVQPIVAACEPCAMTLALPASPEGHLDASAEPALLEAAETRTVLAVGPGLGIGRGVRGPVTALLTQTEKPIVLDADGLNALGPKPVVLKRSAPLVITPHPGEFARLTGLEIRDIQSRREAVAAEFAAEFDVIVVLKGAGTIVTDGRRVYRNTTGNPGMATGGAGDVLTGVIASLIGQGIEPFAAAQLGVYIHGRAGDLARADVGELSLIATDLFTYLPRAIRSVARG